METTIMGMGGCQNYRPFLGTQNIRCRIILGTQKGTIILTATHNWSLKFVSNLLLLIYPLLVLHGLIMTRWPGVDKSSALIGPVLKT